MSLKVRAYDEVIWYNIWDPDVDITWLANYFSEYNDTWPNVRSEIKPVAKEGCQISYFTLKSMTKQQMAKIDRIDDKYEKLRMICAYGVTGWKELEKEGVAIEPSFTKDATGSRLTEESLDDLGFFGWIDLPLLNMLAVRVMSITRCYS
jgi:hypothetical protein